MKYTHSPPLQDEPPTPQEKTGCMGEPVFSCRTTGSFTTAEQAEKMFINNKTGLSIILQQHSIINLHKL